MNRWWIVAFALALTVLAFGSRAGAEPKKETKSAAAAKDDPSAKFVLKEPVVVEMKEVPAFGKPDAAEGPRTMRYPSGQGAGCGNVPNPSVKYPKLKSKRPLYGQVVFDTGSHTPAVMYHFVLDESGEAEEKAKEGKDKEKAKPETKKSALLESLAKSLAAAAPAPVTLAQPQMPKCDYDLLYFDLNGDRDLTNDGVIHAAEKTPFEGRPSMISPPNRYFKEVAVTFDFGPPVGKMAFPLIPWIYVYGENIGYMQFIPKTARKGKVRLGGQEYIVSLTQSQVVSGRYDRTYVQMEVVAADHSAKGPALLNSASLGQMQLIHDQYLTVSASPLGDKLTIAPYRGELGVLEVGAGGRAITEFGVVGELMGGERIVPLGDTPYYAAPETLPRRYLVPVGDYMLPSFTARCGRLRFSGRMLSGPAAGLAKIGDSETCPVKIRKDKPCVLEFSGKPEVSFVNRPSKDQTFKPGENISISAMLNEPWQKIQITGLWNVTEKKGTANFGTADGRVVSAPQFAQLDPTITIRNSTGEEVTSGKMPFG